MILFPSHHVCQIQNSAPHWLQRNRGTGCWMKTPSEDRSRTRRRREAGPLTPDEAQHFTHHVRRIASILALHGKLDMHYGASV